MRMKILAGAELRLAGLIVPHLPLAGAHAPSGSMLGRFAAALSSNASDRYVEVALGGRGGRAYDLCWRGRANHR